MELRAGHTSQNLIQVREIPAAKRAGAGRYPPTRRLDPVPGIGYRIVKQTRRGYDRAHLNCSASAPAGGAPEAIIPWVRGRPRTARKDPATGGTLIGCLAALDAGCADVIATTRWPPALGLHPPIGVSATPCASVSARHASAGRPGHTGLALRGSLTPPQEPTGCLGSGAAPGSRGTIIPRLGQRRAPLHARRRWPGRRTPAARRSPDGRARRASRPPCHASAYAVGGRRVPHR